MMKRRDFVAAMIAAPVATVLKAGEPYIPLDDLPPMFAPLEEEEIDQVFASIKGWAKANGVDHVTVRAKSWEFEGYAKDYERALNSLLEFK